MLRCSPLYSESSIGVLVPPIVRKKGEHPKLYVILASQVWRLCGLGSAGFLRGGGMENWRVSAVEHWDEISESAMRGLLCVAQSFPSPVPCGKLPTVTCQRTTMESLP